MVLILSENEDYSTIEVLKWLRYIDKDFIRVNDDKDGYTENLLNCLYFDGNGASSIDLNLKDLTSIWFRRSYLNIAPKRYKALDSVYSQINNFNKEEVFVLSRFLNQHLFNNFKSLGNPFCFAINKLICLERAQKFGLKVPAYTITCHKKDILTIKEKGKSLIIKAIQEQINLIGNKNEYHYTNYTEELEEDIVEAFPEKFGYTFFQEKIEKFCDIRVFYLNGDFYSMAIFSQNNKQTKVDFRKYDDAKPNRTVPFKLPKDIEFKLRSLLDSYNLNCSSIDLIYCKNKSFYFLEINPIGQFGMVSYPCNYYLEKKIAMFL